MLDLPLDVLVCEMSHFGPEELADVLRPVKLHALCLVHLSEDLASDNSALQDLMEQLIPEVGDVLIPEDGEVLDF
jgi:ribonuclease BN (tRNA processing enzyme)